MQRGVLDYYNRNGEESQLGIKRIQIVQDTAQQMHSDEDVSYINFNRAGMGMLKIFTLHELEHPQDATAATMELQSMMQHLAISKANFA
jgi:aspartyl-tRNA(Asn)/glutamyl-tRNA(Gln) amidotransferase subunit B